ncbi:C4-dicarboxylate TRAP transporter small permease protein [Desulfonema limicola]|uniref:C4-dicarboxylate TRAP transporter small permease protein n=1 Tax=Desulfonema limicola TaxID=45656 RepID=A0A975GIN4_9BACT|nr:TRAP transporter small permease subunit [Desulfonema limicola]QTA82123.1 C4-dicarboxylate TRAP transporter small permease protein [Desulfonema limicola]
MLNKISNAIDIFNKKQGDIASMLIFPLLGVVIYEVFMRYAFNSPTTWGFEVTAFLYGLHYMFGMAYTEVHDGHVRVDIFTARLPKKWQEIMSAFTACVFFLPVMTCMTIWSFKFAATSAAGLERNSTSWGPHIWPFKILMAVTFLFLLIQGISGLLKNINAIFGKNQ